MGGKIWEHQEVAGKIIEVNGGKLPAKFDYQRGSKIQGNGYGSIPINTIFNGMNIHLPAILGFTRYQGFDS